MRFLPDRYLLGAATLGKLGYLGKAPGTIGSLAGLGFYTLFFYLMGLFGYVLLLAAFVYLAIGICDEAERRMMKRDPGEVIIDEVVAVPLVFFALQPLMAVTGHVWLYMLAGFLLFRIFDILKPLGIGKLQELPGGLGVVVDDLAAAAVSCVILHVAVRMWVG